MNTLQLCKYTLFLLLVVLGTWMSGCTPTESIDDNGTTDLSDSAAIALTINTVDSAQIKFSEYLTLGDTVTARTQLVAWLKTRDNVIDAGISTDGYTIWIANKGDISSAILTYKKSSGISKLSARGKARDSFGKSESISIQKSSQQENRGVGMYAYLMAPFNWEFGSTDEIPGLRKYYTDPLTKLMIGGVMYKDSLVTPDVLKMTLISPSLPANHLIINSHGGTTKVKGKHVGYVLTGIEANNFLAIYSYKDDLKQGRLVITGEDGNQWLGFTPHFVRYYSGKPSTENEHFLVRYVHINACYSFDSTMVNAFLESGALCYSGFTHQVSCDYGKDVAKQYFEFLSEHHTIQEAFDQVTPKLDPHDTSGKCMFKIQGKTDPQRFFYRVILTFGTAPMNSSTCQWIPVFTGGTGDSTWFETSTFLEDTTFAGRLLVGFTNPAVGNYSAVTNMNVIRFEEQATGRTWIANKSEFEINNQCAGTINVTKFDNKNGGTVEGSFSGTLTSPHLTLPDVWDMQPITGTFVLIRSDS